MLYALVSYAGGMAEFRVTVTDEGTYKVEHRHVDCSDGSAGEMVSMPPKVFDTVSLAFAYIAGRID